MNIHNSSRLPKSARQETISPRPVRDIVVIGASAGGVEALRIIASGLPPDFPATVLVALHMPRNCTSHLPDILGRAGPLSARFAEDGAALERGRILVVPPGSNLRFGRNRVHLIRDSGIERWCPSVDILLRAAAMAHGERVAAVILTGYQNDGAAGLAEVQRAGGATIVQEPREAEASSMPLNAVASVTPDYILPVAAVSPVLSWLARNDRRPALVQQLDRADFATAQKTATVSRSYAAGCTDLNGMYGEMVNVQRGPRPG